MQKLPQRADTSASALLALAATEYGYRCPDGVWLIPLGAVVP